MNQRNIELNANGGWCWYQDDRVIVDRKTGVVLVASVACIGGADGVRRDGDIDVTTFDPATGQVATFPLANIVTHDHGDDHNVAALWQRPDGRYLAMYTHDATVWHPAQSFAWPRHDLVGDGCVAVTYSNLLYLSAEGERGRLYNIARAAGQVWQIATSDDWGETWAYRGVLTRPPAGGREYSNGYLKFNSNGLDRIDFISTEAHPRDYNNGVYHGYIEGGKTYNAAGNVVDPDTWSSTELAHMGPGLYDTEEDYTGLGAIDSRNGRTLYVSTAFDPRSNTPLANSELFKGETEDDGRTWIWSPVTQDSSPDNLRPRLTVLDENRAVLLWLHGAYHSMRGYDLAVMARFVDWSDRYEDPLTVAFAVEI